MASVENVVSRHQKEVVGLPVLRAQKVIKVLVVNGENMVRPGQRDVKVHPVLRAQKVIKVHVESVVKRDRKVLADDVESQVSPVLTALKGHVDQKGRRETVEVVESPAVKDLVESVVKRVQKVPADVVESPANPVVTGLRDPVGQKVIRGIRAAVESPVVKDLVVNMVKRDQRALADVMESVERKVLRAQEGLRLIAVQR